MRYAKSKMEAEDILQEGFFKILRDLRQFSGDGDVKWWMRKVMVNSALMHIRKYRKIEFSEINEKIIEDPELVENSFLQSERASTVVRIIQKLEDPYQTVFNLRAIEGYSFKEIAEKLDGNEATLRSHYMRARKKLQTILNQALTDF